MTGTAHYVGHFELESTKQMEEFMIKEQLSPDLITEQLEKRLKQLETSLSNIKKETNFQLNDHIRIHQKGKYVEYYQLCKDRTNYGNYILLKDTKAAARIAQNDYNKKAIKLLQKEINAIKFYFVRTRATALLKLYTKMSPARQKLITPVTLTNEQYADLWLNVTWQGLPFSPDAPVHTTMKQERVRSKSEVLIADALERHGIPYRYEYPLIIKKNNKSGIRPSTGSGTTVASSGTTNSITLHPDFLCLNVRTRQEFYWEHFGLMDSPDYAKNAASKLRLYTQNGIFPGHNLIITMEKQNEPLSTSTIDMTIKQYLK